MGKGTKIISELSTFFKENDNSDAISCIMSVMNTIKLSDKHIGLSKMHNCKMNSWQVVMILLVFPFFAVKNALRYQDSTLGKLFKCKKDMFYDFLNDDRVDWKRILTTVNRQLLRFIENEESKKRNDPRKKNKQPVCLVADDTDLPKTGMKMELIGKIHSHVHQKSILGYKCMNLMRTDGKSQMLIDMSLHGEEGKNPDKKQGLTAKQRAARYTKEHTTDTAKARIEDYFKKKTDKLIEMVKDAIKNGHRFDYLLVDSWFTSKELVKFICSRRIKCNLMGMIRMGNTKYATEFGELDAKKIVAKLKKEKRIKKCSTLKCAYCMIDAELDGCQVRLFFCKRGRKGDWNGLLTTNISLQFLEAYRIYQMRWAIEVSYKEQKELLGLGKCQSQNFNAQIGSVTLSMIQYNILSIVKRFNSYETIGALFDEAVTGTVEFSVTEKIWKMLLEAIFIVSEKFSIYAPDLLSAIIEGDEAIMALMRLNVKLKEAV